MESFETENIELKEINKKINSELIEKNSELLKMLERYKKLNERYIILLREKDNLQAVSKCQENFISKIAEKEIREQFEEEEFIY